MRVPPWPVRRLVLAPLMVLAELAFLLVSPALALLAAVVAPLLGSRPLRTLAIADVYTARHIAATLACLGLSPRDRDAHQPAPRPRAAR